ncbi:hybrid sensor histidine kinase/response regulator [Salinimonas chungwhensis]|uniref:hybrid sensor histidine kinase/response regulator n=1 Tax=Salinimonas chungwhensis TaxID=265425 RepID=UPI000371DF83|nr:hybrid sensor histidine kinase/response regulator [Salinimonas chungwhensis]
MNLISRIFQDKWQWILFLIPLVLTIVLATSGIFYLRESEIDYRMQMVHSIERAESDFTNGVMHFALSDDGQSPWQRRVGIALINKSLVQYREIDLKLTRKNTSEQLIGRVEALSEELNTLIDNGRRVDVRLREDIYQISERADKLERQVVSDLERRRVQQKQWFTAIIITSCLILALLGLALVRSERYRYALNSSLKISEQRFLKLLQNTDEVFWLEGFESEILLYVSEAFEKLSHLKPHEVLNQKAAWHKLIHPDDIDMVAQKRAASTQTPCDFECRLIRPDGKTRWIEGRMFPIWKEQTHSMRDNPDFIASVTRDVTEKREMDYRLFQAQKMESLGQLTGGVAHDFNNLITVILANARHIIHRLHGDPEMVRMMTLILRAAERGIGLNQRLLAFASKQQLQPKVILVEELIQESVEMLERTLGVKYRLVFQRTTEPLWVKVDPGQLQNALVNLCLNSRDAMPGGGKITLRLESSSHENLFGVKGDKVHISVKDEGEGIPQDLLDRVLEPFFTTKPGDSGTGLGLSMVFGFVRQSGGNMHIASREGKGTTVHMVLPLCEHEPEPKRALLPAHSMQPAEGTTIMLVEDNRLIRENIAAILHQAGYRVIQAENALDALDALAVRKIDLVITDIVMPGALTGFELVERVNVTYPDLKILVTSGFTQSASEYSGRWHFLQKPFSDEMLLEHVKKTLRSASNEYM